MCVCVRVCACVYVYTYIHIHTHTHVYIDNGVAGSSGQTFPSRRTPRSCSVCGSPRLCVRREHCLIMARFGRWPLAWRKIWAVSMFDLAV